MDDEYFYEIESSPIQLITIDIYNKNNRNNLLHANYDYLIHKIDRTPNKFITNSNIQTLTLDKLRDVIFVLEDRGNKISDTQIPLILEDSIKDIDRINYYDNLNNKLYFIKKTQDSTKKFIHYTD